jgi:hypothetical protein
MYRWYGFLKKKVRFFLNPNNRKQKTENRKQKTDNRKQITENRQPTTDNRKPSVRVIFAKKSYQKPNKPNNQITR